MRPDRRPEAIFPNPSVKRHPSTRVIHRGRYVGAPSASKPTEASTSALVEAFNKITQRRRQDVDLIQPASNRGWPLAHEPAPEPCFPAFCAAPGGVIASCGASPPASMASALAV